MYNPSPGQPKHRTEYEGAAVWNVEREKASFSGYLSRSEILTYAGVRISGHIGLPDPAVN